MQKQETFVLTGTKDQMRAIQHALELYSRIGIGDLEEVAWMFRLMSLENDSPFSRAPENLDEAHKHITEAKTLLTGMPAHATMGIVNPKVPVRFRIAYDILQVIRHGLYEAEDGPQAAYSVNSREPYQWVKDVPLAKFGTGLPGRLEAPVPGIQSADGPMRLFEVTSVFEKTTRRNGPTVHEIRFLGGARLGATEYHAFKTHDGKYKSVSFLAKGDKIWVDAVAFVGDGSLYVPKRRASNVDA